MSDNIHDDDDDLPSMQHIRRICGVLIEPKGDGYRWELFSNSGKPIANGTAASFEASELAVREVFILCNGSDTRILDRILANHAPSNVH